MKKDLIITLIITILILFNHYAGLRQNEERKNLYKKNNENKIEYLFLSFFTEISFLLSNNYDLYKNEIKNNTDLKYFIKENIDYREFFNYKTQWKNKEMLLFFGNQININFINRYPNFKHMKIFQTFSKNVSVSINFYRKCSWSSLW